MPACRFLGYWTADEYLVIGQRDLIHRIPPRLHFIRHRFSFTAPPVGPLQGPGHPKNSRTFYVGQALFKASDPLVHLCSRSVDALHADPLRHVRPGHERSRFRARRLAHQLPRMAGSRGGDSEGVSSSCSRTSQVSASRCWYSSSRRCSMRFSSSSS